MTNNYQLGLLHIVYMLINTDGRIDPREMDTLLKIKIEENIDDSIFLEFSRSIPNKKSDDIFNRGIELLNTCADEEKLCAFVHLFQLAEADSSISMSEIRLLLLALNLTNVDFNDVSISANLAISAGEKREKVSQTQTFSK